MTARFKNARDKFKKTAKNDYEESFLIKVTVWMLLLGLSAALLYIIADNVEPYFALVNPTTGVNGTGKRWWDYIPLVGWATQSFSGFLAMGLAFFVWGVVQTMQLLWWLIRFDRKAHTGAIKIASVGRYTSTETDSPELRKAKKAHRKIPFFFIRWAGFLALAAYSFDLAVSLWYHPIAASWGDFAFAIRTGNYGSLDWGQGLNALRKVVGFELVFIPWLLVIQWRQARAAGEE